MGLEMVVMMMMGGKGLIGSFGKGRSEGRLGWPL